jgi:cysteine desulfurase/selenocysteine lyase
MILDVKTIKKDFPIFKRTVNGKRLVYLDNAATSQMPLQVINAVVEFDSNHRANVHRGVHMLSEEATDMYEKARETVAKFIHAVVPEEVVFVRNTTEASNLIAYSWIRNNLKKDEIILVSEVEHHSNLVPWQNLAREIGFEIKFISINSEGLLDIKSVNTDWEKVRFVAFNHISNILGSTNNVKEISKYIKSKSPNARIFVDGAQSVPHMPVNVQSYGIDFFAFSGHKMCGPMGIGVLWVNRDAFSELKPYNVGGGMIREVSLEEATYTTMPEFLEAGTPNVSGAVGLAAACDYLNKIGLENIDNYCKELIAYALEKLSARDDVEIYGSTNAEIKGGLITFNLKNIPSHDLASVLNTEGVAVRSGQHCNMPWHKKNVSTSTRLSVYFYNIKEDIDVLISGLDKAQKILGG